MLLGKTSRGNQTNKEPSQLSTWIEGGVLTQRVLNQPPCQNSFLWGVLSGLCPAADGTQCRLLLPGMEPQKQTAFSSGWMSHPTISNGHRPLPHLRFHPHQSPALASDPQRRWNHSACCTSSSHIVFHRGRLWQPPHTLTQRHLPSQACDRRVPGGAHSPHPPGASTKALPPPLPSGSLY